MCFQNSSPNNFLRFKMLCEAKRWKSEKCRKSRNILLLQFPLAANWRLFAIFKIQHTIHVFGGRFGFSINFIVHFIKFESLIKIFLSVFWYQMSFMQLILDLSTIKLFINHRKICRSNQFGCQAFRAKSKDLMSFAGESWREELSEEFKSLDLSIAHSRHLSTKSRQVCIANTCVEIVSINLQILDFDGWEMMKYFHLYFWGVLHQSKHDICFQFVPRHKFSFFSTEAVPSKIPANFPLKEFAGWRTTWSQIKTRPRTPWHVGPLTVEPLSPKWTFIP